MGNHEWCSYCRREGKAHVYLGGRGVRGTPGAWQVAQVHLLTALGDPEERAQEARHAADGVWHDAVELVARAGGAQVGRLG
jgi:hypothetical protein